MQEFSFLGIYPNNVISQCYYAGICLLFAHCSTQLFYSVCQQTAQQSVSGQCRVKSCCTAQLKKFLKHAFNQGYI